MEKTMKMAAAVSGCFTVIFILLYKFFGGDIFLSTSISLGTVFYHFAFRIAVGNICDKAIDVSSYQRNEKHYVGKKEMNFYSYIRVKKWKKFIPSYDNSQFDPTLHTWMEIEGAVYRSEIIHKINAVLSFIPVFLSIYFGAFWVFLITSAAGAAADIIFVIVQRFNRGRMEMAIAKNIK